MKENNNGSDINVGSIGNSIEEDIKQVKDLMKELKEERGDIQISRIQHKLRLSINNILSDYKRVLKENEELLELKVSASAHNRILELEKDNKELKEAYKSEKKMKNEYVKLYQDLLLQENVIPIQKVKDKIEEIDESIKREENERVLIQLHKQRKILQELLESEE